MTELEIADLVRKHLGTPGRIRLPGVPVEYDEERLVEEVTPLRAMELIAHCWERYQAGRNFYPTKLEKILSYAAAMNAGEWKYLPDGDPIVITDGLITGGRHRLHAILLSGKTIRSNVL